MSTTMIKTLAAAALALPLFLAVAPAASAAAPTPAASTRTAAPVDGSVNLCFPLGSVVFCI